MSRKMASPQIAAHICWSFPNRMAYHLIFLLKFPVFPCTPGFIKLLCHIIWELPWSICPRGPCCDFFWTGTQSSTSAPFQRVLRNERKLKQSINTLCGLFALYISVVRAVVLVERGRILKYFTSPMRWFANCLALAEVLSLWSTKNTANSG